MSRFLTKPTKWVCAQHPPSLIRVFAVCMKKAWTLSYSLSTQRRLWSESSLGAQPHCWFCHEAAQLYGTLKLWQKLKVSSPPTVHPGIFRAAAEVTVPSAVHLCRPDSLVQHVISYGKSYLVWYQLFRIKYILHHKNNTSLFFLLGKFLDEKVTYCI